MTEIFLAIKPRPYWRSNWRSQCQDRVFSAFRQLNRPLATDLLKPCLTGNPKRCF